MIKESKDKLSIFTGIGVIFLYLFFPIFLSSFISIFGINYNDIGENIYLILYESLMTLIIIFIYKKDLISNFKDFKKNSLKYIKSNIKYWIIALLLMIVSNSIVCNFTISKVPPNQQMIVDQIKLSPIYTFITAVLISPILEELVFRLSIRKILMKSNILYILFSGIFFGLLHVSVSNNISDLLFIIPYSIPGFMFAYVHSKTNNICVPIALHMIHNLIMLLFQIIIIFF